MKISVMMAAFNAQAHIGAALRSILKQDGMSGLEIIVIDDGSTDDTAEIVAKLAAQHDSIKLIRTANQGVTRARNEALKAISADADLLSFLDSDDLLPSGRYARDIALFRRDPQLDMTFGDTLMFKHANAENTAPSKDSPTARGRTIQLGSATFRAQSLIAVGSFDESFQQAEDMDFLLRFLERAPRYHIQDEVCLYYRRHAHNMTHDQNQLKRDFSRALMLSIVRRRKQQLPPYPANLFDSSGFKEALTW